MPRSRCPAPLVCLSLLTGAAWQASADWCPPALATALLALGLMARGRIGVTVAAFSVGLILAGNESSSNPPIDSQRPVLMQVRVIGHGQRDLDGLKVIVRSEWVRQGPLVACWKKRLLLSLPPTASSLPGVRLVIKGYLRRAPVAANGVAVRPGPWILRTKSLRFVEERPPGVQLWRGASGRLRRLVEDRLEAGTTSRESPGWLISRALVLGDQQQLPKSWLRGLRSAGLSHLIALSGLHLGLLTGVALLLTSGLPRRLQLAAVLMLVIAYLLLVGPRPSLTRAALMLLAVIVAWTLRRAPQPLNSLAWVAGVMVAREPDLVHDLGFRLTVSATAGILVLTPRLTLRWQSIPQWLRLPLSISVSAHLGALPWSLASFHLFTPGAPIWNLVAVPWTAITLVVSLTWVGLAVLSPSLAAWFQPVLDISAAPFAILGELGPAVTRPLSVHVGWWDSAAIAAVLAAAVLARRWHRCLVLLLVAWLWLEKGSVMPASPQLVLLDVGQGEAVLLRDGERAALIDGGGWRRGDIAQRVLLPALSKLGVRQLQAAYLTHPDQDHCGGLEDLLSYMAVPRLYTAPGWQSSRCLSALLTKPGIVVRPLWRGEVSELGRWRLTSLHPRAGSRVGKNHRSLVLLAEAERRRILLTGDLEAGGEEELMQAWGHQLRDLDVLKVAHHGSDTSTTAAWLDLTRPRLAILSSGLGNPYGHPDEAVLHRLRHRGIPLLRTDLHGQVRLEFPGDGSIRVQTPASPRSF